MGRILEAIKNIFKADKAYKLEGGNENDKLTEVI